MNERYKKEIQSWTAHELIVETRHELSQPANAARGIAHFFAHISADEYLKNPEEFNEITQSLLHEIKAILRVVDWLEIWLAEQKRQQQG